LDTDNKESLISANLSRSPALQTKPHELVTAIEWLTAFETKGILDLIAQFDF